MVVKVKLFTIGKPSKRGFSFSRKVVEAYLQSEEHRSLIANRRSTGTITHLHRLEDQGHKKLPTSDALLINRSITHYTKDIFIEGDDVIAELQVLNPDSFTGVTNEMINYLVGLLSSGIGLYVSAAIDNDYDDMTLESKRIYGIIGVDFTTNPDFDDSSVIGVES